MKARCTGLLLALLGYGCAPALPVGSLAPSAAPVATAVAGHVAFPTSLAKDAHIIPTGIGAVLTTSGAAYKLLQADDDPDLAVAGALVLALDPTDHHRLAGIAPTHTDATGHFQLTYAADGYAGNVLVAVFFRTPDHSRAFRLLALAKPGPEAAVSWRSTAVVAALTPAELHDADPSGLAPREEAYRRAYAGETPEHRLDALAHTLGLDPGQVPSDDVDAVPLVLPSPLVLPTPAPGATGAGQPAGGSAGGAGQTVGSVGQTVGGTVGSTGQTVGGTVGSTTQTVGGTVGSTTQTVGNTVGSTTQTVGGVVKAVTTPVAPVVGPVTQAAGGVVQAVTQPVASTAATLLPSPVAHAAELIVAPLLATPAPAATPTPLLHLPLHL